MHHGSKRRWFAVGLGVLAVPLLAASIAYACAALATISLHASEAAPGATVSGGGKGFSNSHGGAPSTEPVVLRWNSRSGPVLWSGRPDANGSVSFSFRVPNVGSGDYVVIATQTNADGQPAPGTPARASLRVNAPAPAQPTQPAAAPQEASQQPAPAQAPAANTASRPATRTATRPAPARTTATTQAPAAAPAPATAAAPVPTTETATAPAPTVSPADTPAPAPVPAEQRSATVTTAVPATAGSSGSSPMLALGLVGLGVLLSLGAVALVLANRRGREVPASIER